MYWTGKRDRKNQCGLWFFSIRFNRKKERKEVSSCVTRLKDNGMLIFIGKLMWVENIPTLRNLFLCEIICWSLGFNPRPLAQCLLFGSHWPLVVCRSWKPHIRTWLSRSPTTQNRSLLMLRDRKRISHLIEDFQSETENIESCCCFYLLPSTAVRTCLFET